MTREEAKAYIIQHCNPDYPKGNTEWETAMNMAISALQQPEPCEDAVSRQAAIALAKDICVPIKDGTVYKHRCIDPDAIKELPSVQPEIVWCENCKYCRKVDESEYWCYGFCSPARLVRKDDFCSHGCKNESV